MYNKGGDKTPPLLYIAEIKLTFKIVLARNIGAPPDLSFHTYAVQRLIIAVIQSIAEQIKHSVVGDRSQ